MVEKVFSSLSKELRKSLKRRSLPLRKGDRVKVMRGTFEGKEAKVIGIERANARVLLENITRKKADGTERNVGIHASKLQIVEIESKDEKRIKATAFLQSKKPGEKEPSAKAAKGGEEKKKAENLQMQKERAKEETAKQGQKGLEKERGKGPEQKGLEKGKGEEGEAEKKIIGKGEVKGLQKEGRGEQKRKGRT